MQDNFIKLYKAVGLLVLTLVACVLIVVPVTLFGRSNIENSQGSVIEIKEEDIVRVSNMDISAYTAQVIRDAEGNPISVVFNSSYGAPVTEVKIKTNSSYVDNSTTIINKSESHFYKVIIVIAVLAFVAFMICYAVEHKKREAERTERILSTPLESFGNTEIKGLKDKYK